MDATLPTMLASHGKGWKDIPAYNCSTCVEFDQPYSISTERLQEMTSFSEILNFQAGDKKSGDRFGYSLAIDGNQVRKLSRTLNATKGFGVKGIVVEYIDFVRS